MDFTVSSEEFLLEDVLNADALRRIEFAQFVPIGQAYALYFWVETDDIDAFEATVRGSSDIPEFTHLNSQSRRYLYAVEWETYPNGLLTHLQTHDLLVDYAAGKDRAWKFRLIAANREAFAAFQSDCNEDGIDLTICRVSNSSEWNTGLYGLTEKQRDALLLALEGGYYEHGTNVTLSDLSEELNISQQSLSARLKRGTQALLKNTVSVH